VAALLPETGFVEALVGIGVPREPAELYAEAVRRGATLVAVRIDPADRDCISSILESCGPIAVAEREAEWRREGWQRFEANGGPHPGPYYGSATTTSGAPAEQGVSVRLWPESGSPPGGWTIRREGPVGADWNEPRVRIYPPAPPADHPPGSTPTDRRERSPGVKTDSRGRAGRSPHAEKIPDKDRG
jgi:hypothetical protein